MAGVKAPHMAGHGDNAGFLGNARQRLGVFDAVGDGDFDQYVLAGAHHLLAVAEMHLGRRREDHRVGARDALGQLAGVMWNAVFFRHLSGGVLIAADQRRDVDVGNALERIEMLLAEGALPRYANFHWLPSPRTLMPGLEAGIHDFKSRGPKTWMAGTSPAMTCVLAPNPLN